MNISHYHIITLIIIHTYFCNLLPMEMEQNKHIGETDKQILLHYTQEKGPNFIQEKINKIHINSNLETHSMCFPITFTLDRAYNAQLFNTLFPLVNNSRFVSLNSKNLKWNNECKSAIPIDHCTCLMKIGNDRLTVITMFYNKTILQETFTELLEVINKNK